MLTRFRALFCRVYLLIHASYDIHEHKQNEYPFTSDTSRFSPLPLVP